MAEYEQQRFPELVDIATLAGLLGVNERYVRRMVAERRVRRLLHARRLPS